MNRYGSDKRHVCHNALQTSLIREQIRRRISSTINCEILNRMQNYKTIANRQKILCNVFNQKSIYCAKKSPNAISEGGSSLRISSSTIQRAYVSIPLANLPYFEVDRHGSPSNGPSPHFGRHHPQRASLREEYPFGL